MKITKISVEIAGADRVRNALVAAFGPFGSLTQGVDGEALAETLIRWVNAKSEEQSAIASELVGLVWAAETEDFSSIEVGRLEVSLRPPTSGTKIHLRRGIGEGYYVEVFFGTEDSEALVFAILAAAEHSGVRFSSYNGESMIEHQKVLQTLRQLAYTFLVSLPMFYSGPILVEAMARAREEVLFFEKAK